MENDNYSMHIQMVNEFLYALCRTNTQFIDDFITNRLGGDVNSPLEYWAAFPRNACKTLLVYAIQLRSIRTVQYLVEQKSANIEQWDNQGNSPLLWAIKIPNVDIVRFLLQHGTQTNYFPANMEKRSPLQEALFTCLDSYDEVSLNEKHEIVHALISNKADPNLRNSQVEYSIPPLHYAMFMDQFPIIQILFDTPGAIPPNVEVTEGMALGRPLHTLVTNNSDFFFYRVLYILLQRGAHINAIDRNGMTPLHLLCDVDSKENVYPSLPGRVAALLHGGADPYAVDNCNKRPIQYAISHGALGVINTLCNHYFDVMKLNEAEWAEARYSVAVYQALLKLRVVRAEVLKQKYAAHNGPLVDTIPDEVFDGVIMDFVLERNPPSD